MTETDRLAQLLEQIRALYDDASTQFVYWTDLQTVPAAVADFQECIAAAEAALKQADEQVRNLRFEEWQLSSMEETEPEEYPYDPGFAPIEGARSDREKRETKRSITPRPDSPQVREELQRNVRRFIRHRLKPETLQEFNRLARNGEVPTGQLLCILDWDAAYASPLYAGESTGDHIARLELWGGLLAAYLDTLSAETKKLERQYRPSLKMWAVWRKRSSEPDGWTQEVANANRVLQAQLHSRHEQIEELIERVRELRGSQPRQRE